MPSAADIFRSMVNSPIAPWAVFQRLGELQAAPQQPHEPDLVYNMRKPIPIGALPTGREFIAKQLETPADRAAATKAHQAPAVKASDVFPTSYKDPVYDAADQYASQLTGVPAQLISLVRTRGERTNAGVTSVAGANTPYQITPKTRQGIIKVYGIDPWSSPEKAALGAAYVLREHGGQPKTWDNPTALKAIGGYFGGWKGSENPFRTDIADANGQTPGGYVQQVMGKDTKLLAPFVNPYDPSYDQAAMGMLGKERQALMTPFSATINTGPAPEMPKPEPLPTTDFSKADAALEAMRPVEMSEKERMSRERDGFFKGIAQAMMRTPGDEGIGTFLLRLGAGALGGKMAAKDEIRDEQSKFDDKMARFNAAIYQNEMGKAQTAHQDAVAQVQQNNQYNLANWQVAYNQWTKNSSIDISGTNAVITQRDDKTGTMSVRTVPIQSAVDAAIAQQGAQLFQHMGGMQFAGNQLVASQNNALVGRAAIAAMQNSSDNAEKDGAAAAAPAFYATNIVQNGQMGDLLGADGAKSLEDNVSKRLIGMGLQPGTKEWIDRHDRLASVEIAKLGLADPGMMQKMMQVGGVSRSFQALDALQSAKTRTATDAQGRTTTSTTMNASDVFDDPGNSINGTDLTPYGYVRR
jgi:hypothetical protein